MPSVSFEAWEKAEKAALDELEAAHKKVGGQGPGRRTVTQQINHAYVGALSAQFQRYCRSLHSEATQVIATGVPNTAIQTVLVQQLTRDRKLDSTFVS